MSYYSGVIDDLHEEVAALKAELATAKAALEAARVAVGKMRTGHRHDCACCQPFLDRGCDCGEELIATARLALGLEAKP